MARARKPQHDRVGRPAHDLGLLAIHIAATAKAHGWSINHTCERLIVQTNIPRDGFARLTRRGAVPAGSLKRRYYRFRRTFLRDNPGVKEWVRTHPGSFGPYVDRLIAGEAALIEAAGWGLLPHNDHG